MAHDWSMEEAARLGATLRRIDPSLMKGSGREVWLQGGEPYLDVFIQLDEEGAPSWVQVTARGRAMTWDAATGALRTGHTTEKTVRHGYPSAHEVHYDTALDTAVVAFLRVMLSAKATEPVVQQALFLMPKAG
jgi:hypothetical protein